MNNLKEDFSRATFELKMDDLDRPLILLDAFQQLYFEVWRYADLKKPYRQQLPRNYVQDRFVQQLVGDQSRDEKEMLIRKATSALLDLGYAENCPATGDLLVRWGVGR